MHIVMHVLKQILHIHVQTVKKLSALIPKKFPIRIRIGTNLASYVLLARSHSLDYLLDPRITKFTVVIVMTQTLPPNVLNVRSYLYQEPRKWSTKTRNGTKNVSAVLFVKM
uniref:Uncharacterized protein n=1 Tax=Cacopsylla melanoneura TaxID=428564 RepID=A0A8D8RYC4_9HEMI